MAGRTASHAVDKESGCPIRVRHLDDVIENDSAAIHRSLIEKTLRYGHLSKEDFKVVDALLHGGVDTEQLPCQRPKVVRMFVCSSGADFEAERNYLQENVYPMVRQYCRDNYGLDFQMVDMYWGATGIQSTDPNKVTPTVYEELSHCQELSMGPNFVSFIGQKYGSANIPLEIPSVDMTVIRDVLAQHGTDSSLLDTWYTKDINVAPHVFRLQPQTSMVDASTLQPQNPSEDREVVLKLIQEGAIGLMDPLKYSRSDFEQLLQAGIFDIDKETRDQNCLVYIRDIENLDKHLTAKNAFSFVDIVPDSCEWDTVKKQKISDIRQQVENNLLSCNILKSKIELNGCILDESKGGDYVSNIGRHFYSTVTQMVDKQMELYKKNAIGSDTLCHEVATHWERSLDFSSNFVGREDILNAIKGYLLSETDTPLVIYGETGSGKTTVVAKAANDINEAIVNSHLSMPTAVIPRFIGETGLTNDIQPLLLHLCHQLAFISGRYRQDIPSEYKALKNYFIDLVQRGEYGGMLVVLIDGLDLLSNTDNGHKLDWLPPRIAANVKIIVTANTENETMISKLENKFESGLVEIPPFSSTDCENFLKLTLVECKRSVNYDQWKKILNAFEVCTSPLFCKLVFEQVLQWKSFDEPINNKLEHSVDDFVRQIFVNLEKKHGKMLVSKVFGYLSVSKTGLSESEIEDILALDDDLLNWVYVKNDKYPNIRRMPHRRWARLRQDISAFLVQREMDGIAILDWKYSPFARVALSMYCADDTDESENIYSNIADYYLGTWSGIKRKSFRHPTLLMAKYKKVERDDDACRYVPKQPMVYGTDDMFNTRKMSQLPHSLVKSKRFEDLKSAVFCNYEWLFCKLQVYPIERVLADFNLFDDREVSLVGDALRMSKSALTVDTKSLGMELTGRLLPHLSKYPNIRNLIRQCDLDSQRSCPLVPNCQIYSSPGGPLEYECDVGGDAHCPIDIDVFSSPDGILLTAKPYYSNRLQVWELMYGDERPDIMLPIGQVHPTRNGKYLNIFVEDKSLKIFKPDCGVQHGDVEIGHGKVSDIEVSDKYVAFIMQKRAGPCIVDIERSQILHKFTYHSHAVAISVGETYVAFNSERNILLYELPLMQRKCVATASDVANDIIFIDETPRCYVLTKSKLVESISFDVVNRKYKCRTVLTDLEAQECIPSNSRELMLIRCGKTIHLLDTFTDKVRTRFQKLPPGVFVDSTSTFSSAGFTPNDRMIVASRYTYLIIWDSETYAPIRVLQSTVSPMIRIFTSDSVNKVVSLLENNTFQVWNLDNLDRDTLHAMEIHQGAVKSAKVSSEAGYILSHDDEIPDAKIVSLATGKIVDTLQHAENETGKIVEICLSPDGAYAVTRAKIDHGANASADTTFEALTDDVMWEVETASKVFHTITNRYIVFSPTSETAAFVTCAFYNRHDWSENIYNVFIVHPETSSNYTIDFPYNTEFVAPPHIVRKGDNNFFVAIIQTCKRTLDPSTKKEVSRWTEVRLFIQKLTPAQPPQDQALLRPQNLTKHVGDNDQFLNIKPVSDGNVLVIYAKDAKPYEFETDRGIVQPRCVQKGAVLIDIENVTTLKVFEDFLDPSSSIDDLLVSKEYTVMVDTDLRVFIYRADDISCVAHLTCCRMAPKSAKLAMNGKYIIGISDSRRKILVVRASDGMELGSTFVHGRAECLDIAHDDRTVVVGCQDGRVMILSLILGFCDPLREFIEAIPSRRLDADDDCLISTDVRHISRSTPDQHRLSARMRRTAVDEERRPPSFTTLQRAVTISRQSSRQRGANACIQQ